MAVIDEFGKLLGLHHGVPHAAAIDVAGAQRTLAALARKHRANTVVIGNGTGSRETEEVVADLISNQMPELRYTIVNEAGASVYSASKLASEEYPDPDVTTRGAMSLGRRLQDPLAELVKIPVQSIGVGNTSTILTRPNWAARSRAWWSAPSTAWALTSTQRARACSGTYRASRHAWPKTSWPTARKTAPLPIAGS